MRALICLLLLLPLPAFAEEDGPYSDLDEPPLVIEGPEELRALAEIDGDPETFTEEEREKFQLLGLLLGVDAVAPVADSQPHDHHDDHEGHDRHEDPEEAQ